MENNKKEKRRLPVYMLVIIDILCAGLCLVIFAFFHHGRAWLVSEHELKKAAAQSVQTVAAEAETGTETEAEEDTLQEQVPEADDEPVDDFKFAEYMTDEVVITDSSYSSRNIYINITSYSAEDGVISSPYYVADIYVRDVKCIQSYFAGEKYIPSGHGEEIMSMFEKSGAILATNGDYYSMQMGSGVLRNGELCREPSAQFDTFVLYNDGSVRIYQKNELKHSDDFEAAIVDAWQVWSFGPSLLDENGVQYENLRDEIYDVMANRNPRTGIGYYEPGHYCLVVVDGRVDGAPGATIEEFASIFESLGCAQAYNLDGGGSSVMAFDGEIVSDRSQERKLPDIILVKEIEEE